MIHFLAPYVSGAVLLGVILYRVATAKSPDLIRAQALLAASDHEVDS